MWNQKEAEHVRLKIRNWLLELGYDVQPQTVEATFWALVAQNKQTGMGCGVFVHSHAAYTVNFAATIELHGYRSALEAQNSQQRRDLLFELRLKLIEIGVSFSLPADNIPPALSFEAQVLKEDLSKSNTVGAINRIHRALLTTMWLMQWRLAIDETSNLPPQVSPGIH